MLGRLKRQRGDTIIEVLFATTIFSMVAVGGLSIMNQGTAMAQRALEIGLVRQQIDAQADALRYMSQAYIADFGGSGLATQRWNNVIFNNQVSEAVPFDSIVSGGECTLPTSDKKPFAINIRDLDTPDPQLVLSREPATYSKINYDLALPTAEGVWVQAVRSPSAPGLTGFYDFHIRACWESPGQVVPMTIGTIVRLYEPRN